MSKYRIFIADKVYEMEIQKVDDSETDAGNHSAVSWSGGKASNSADPNVNVINPASSRKVVNDGCMVKSPMPGTILKLMVADGETVTQGQVILILEAMKMENEIVAPKAGQVIGLRVEEGQTVQGNDVLFRIED